MIVGIDYWAGFTRTFLVNRDLPFLKDAGIKIVRQQFAPEYEPYLIETVPVLANNGIKTLGLLIRRDLVDDIDAWGDWVYNRVLAYRDHVKFWEIWNEANWGTGFQDNPVGYTKFLKRAYTKAKQADPNCIILGGALLGTQDSAVNYLRTMYDNGAKDYMDAVSVHPYCGSNPPEYPNVNSWGSGFWKLQDVRNLMVERGDAKKKIWITEMGWTTTPPGTEEEQAAYIKRALQMAQSWGWVEGFIIFNWMDSGSASIYYGLVREKYSAPYTYENFCKPSFFAVKDFIASLRPSPLILLIIF
jgi:exo-beta-1,3-glucanase (GH17 family)